MGPYPGGAGTAAGMPCQCAPFPCWDTRALPLPAEMPGSSLSLLGCPARTFPLPAGIPGQGAPSPCWDAWPECFFSPLGCQVRALPLPAAHPHWQEGCSLSKGSSRSQTGHASGGNHTKELCSPGDSCAKQEEPEQFLSVLGSLTRAKLTSEAKEPPPSFFAL